MRWGVIWSSFLVEPTGVKIEGIGLLWEFRAYCFDQHKTQFEEIINNAYCQIQTLVNATYTLLEEAEWFGGLKYSKAITHPIDWCKRQIAIAERCLCQSIMHWNGSSAHTEEALAHCGCSVNATFLWALRLTDPVLLCPESVQLLGRSPWSSARVESCSVCGYYHLCIWLIDSCIVCFGFSFHLVLLSLISGVPGQVPVSVVVSVN